jgi:hypothetical protein
MSRPGQIKKKLMAHEHLATYLNDHQQRLSRQRHQVIMNAFVTEVAGERKRAFVYDRPLKRRIGESSWSDAALFLVVYSAYISASSLPRWSRRIFNLGNVWCLYIVEEPSFRFESLRKVLKQRNLEQLICRRGDSPTLLFYSAFQSFFDFPQYSDTLRHLTIHTVRTNRIILCLRCDSKFSSLMTRCCACRERQK